MSANPATSKIVQARLALERVPIFDRAGFIVSDGNRPALEAIEGWRRWPDPRLVLVGPANSGKTHLAAIWAQMSGARILSGSLDIATTVGHPVLYEDADRLPAGDDLFHLLNAAGDGRAVLMTARRPPREWTTDLPDLRSRLNALSVVGLPAPDDGILLGLLQKFFRERNIRPAADVLVYLAHRIERSAAAAAQIVERIDEAAAADGREITRALARQVLRGDELATHGGD